jgi:mannosyltransferase
VLETLPRPAAPVDSGAAGVARPRRAAAGGRDPRPALHAAALVGVVLAAVAALVLRLWTGSPMWLDEAQSVAIARLPLGELLQALRADGSPPLYYLLLHGWTAVFGPGELAARSLSGLASLLAIPVMYAVGRRLGQTREHGVVAAVVLAANPWAVRYATEARMYALLVLLVLLAALALDRTLSAGGRGPVLALGATTGLLLLTHYWAFFLVGAVATGLLLAGWRRPRRRPAARRGLAGVALGGLLFIPWLPSFLFQVGHTGAPWADVPGFGRLTTLPLEWSGGDVPAARWVVLVMWPLLLLGALAPVTGWTVGDRRTRRAPACWPPSPWPPCCSHCSSPGSRTPGSRCATPRSSCRWSRCWSPSAYSPCPGGRRPRRSLC